MHDDLLAALAEWNPTLDGAVDRHTSLIASARLDSLGLMHLLSWIEQRVERPIDVSTVDMTTEWDTVDAVVRFVERERSRR